MARRRKANIATSINRNTKVFADSSGDVSISQGWLHSENERCFPDLTHLMLRSCVGSLLLSLPYVDLTSLSL